METFITGATGFIGRHLLKKLLEESNIYITALARKESNISFLKDKGVKIVYGDITKKETLKKILEDFDLVYHCTGFVGEQPWEKLYKINVIGTKNICELSLQKRVKRVIYLSSVATINGNKERPLNDRMPYAPVNSYGLSKVEAEKVALEYRRKGLRISILRPCVVYGGNEPHLLGRVSRMLKLGIFPIVGNGEKKLHLVYVENLVEAMRLASFKEKAVEGTYIIADEYALPIKRIFTILAEELKVKHPFIHIPKSLAELVAFGCEILNKTNLKLPFGKEQLNSLLTDRTYDISPALQNLGFYHKASPEEALRLSIEKRLGN